jgi:long-subunit fatty acid transport protein
MKKTSLFIICLFIVSISKAQNVITTGVPFLLVAADARAAGMADSGVSTSADNYSQQWNPAKYAFALDKQGFSASYTPYLTSLVNDISLGQLNYYNRLDERSAFAVSLRYFGLGEIELRENSYDDARIVSPNEFAIDGSYSLKLSNKFSMAVGARFINSNLKITTDSGDSSAASSFAIDLAGFFQSEEVAYNSFNGRWRAGFNIQNLGPKINYDNTDSDSYSSFLPANLKLGTGFDFILDDYNKVSVNAEIGKLLVPTPKTDEETDSDTVLADYNSIGWFEGAIQSFTDAPGGLSEELKEYTYSLGAEYLYQDSFALRAGYFHESADKGSRKYMSLGAGFKYNVVKIDVSYLISTSTITNPLENTLRFSLSFNFGEKYDEY